MKCIICGREIEKSSYSNAVLCSSECFSKDFWNNTLKDPNRLIVHHSAFYVGNENERGSFRGFGGSPFYVKMLKDTPDHPAGSLFKSTNMWSNGDIPEEYDVEDNAVFLSKSEYEALGGTI